MSLSQRGTSAVSQPLRADLEVFFEATDNLYDAQDNPNGKFTLCIAENGLCWPEIEEKLRDVATQSIPEWVRSYTNITGAPELKEAAAGFLGKFLAGGRELDPEKIACAAGAAAVIEMSALLLGDPGDVVVIPGPAYMAYTPDLGNIAGLERYDLHPLAASSSAGTGGRGPKTRYDLTTEDLEKALLELGDRFRVLLLTQPNNPTGQVFSEHQLRTISDWCDAHEIHLVVNEIYALSILDQTHADVAEDYPQPVPFVSVLGLLEDKKSDYLHWWYAISKDFGLSGLRLGLAYSHNEDYRKAWGNYGAGSMVSNHTQWLMANLFADHEWLKSYVATNKKRITESYATVIRTLKKNDVPYAAAAGSLFVWIDLSRFLTADTEHAELALWQGIYDETGVLLTSPLGMGGAVRGWFRMVYSCVDLAGLSVAIKRLDSWIKNQ